MENKHYSKTWTNFETQCMAFTKLRMGLSVHDHLVRGHSGYIEIYKTTDNAAKPKLLLTIHVRASASKEECGFFKKSENEWLLIGGDIAWNIVEKVRPLL